VDDKLTQLEPNRLLTTGVEEANGYSSLESDRHAAYVRAVEYTDNHLLDLWNVRYVVRRNVPRLLPSYGGTSFHPQRPLFSGKRGTPGAGGSLLPDGGETTVDELRVVAGLWDAEPLVDGSEVVRVVLEGTDGSQRTFRLRAGRDVSDATSDAPGAAPVSHARAEVAFQYQRENPAGDRYGEELFYSRHPVNPPMRVSRVTVVRTGQVGGFELYGVGLWNAASGEVTQARDKAKYRPVYADAQLRILENTATLPRAFLVGQGIEAPPGHDVLSWMLDGPFDPRQTVILEGGSATRAGLRSSSLLADIADPIPTEGTATLGLYTDDHVVLRTSNPSPGYLVLTDAYYPGWQALVDGQPASIQRGDYLFRAVAVPAGQHTVEFRYQPRSVALGGAISLLAAWIILLVGLQPVVHHSWAWLRRAGRPVAELLPAPGADGVPEAWGSQPQHPLPGGPPDARG
jgi:hypothetical protein